MQSWHLHIEGQVQGVGFRPFVHREAISWGLTGTVSNGPDGLHVRFQATEEIARRIKDQILAGAPALARITGCILREIPDFKSSGFCIVESENNAQPRQMLAPDFGLCRECRSELNDPKNRRYRYAFTTCTSCGPRYSIVRGLPYDRVRTEMEGFVMCSACEAEYGNPDDRRYHSQTNSCQGCGVQLQWHETRGEGAVQIVRAQDRLLDLGVDVLRRGRILAVKGVGGYLLLCDATSAEAVRRLRARKMRPEKPFALLYPDLESVLRNAALSSDEARMLQSPESPIVILKAGVDLSSALCIDEIAPGMDRIGVMLPNAPVLELLSRSFGRPLVATSGNISGSPVIHEDQVAVSVLPAVADGILANDRPVTVPQDDSVMAFTPVFSLPILMRRSRGFAPGVFLPRHCWSGVTRLALGAEMKGAVGILSQGQVFLSQFLGDLGQFGNQRNCRRSVTHLLELLETTPQLVACDAHPEYFTSSLAEELGQMWGVPISRFQHHKAHFAALLGEHDLCHTDSRILGVVWDGTGFGEDGRIWGSEYFLWEGGEMVRCDHLEPFSNIAGDKMAREPRLSAFAAGWETPVVREALQSHFSDVELNVYQRLISRNASIETTSMGRLFDAVAFLLGGPLKTTFEAQAGIWVEECARRYVTRNGWVRAMGLQSFSVGRRLNASELLEQLVYAMRRGEPVDQLSMRFHLTLSEWVRKIADRESADILGFTGGVFQNGLLIDVLTAAHGRDRKLLFHGILPPNDENIAFGQLVLSENEFISTGR